MKFPIVIKKCGKNRNYPGKSLIIIIFKWLYEHIASNFFPNPCKCLCNVYLYIAIFQNVRKHEFNCLYL